MSKRYWSGYKNKTVRYYFYVQRGLALLNEARYLVMALFGIYFALKLENIWIIVLMFGVSVPILLALGWLYTHHMAKIMDWLNVEFSTHFSRYNIELQEKQLKLLEEVRDEIKDNKSKNMGG